MASKAFKANMYYLGNCLATASKTMQPNRPLQSSQKLWQCENIFWYLRHMRWDIPKTENGCQCIHHTWPIILITPDQQSTHPITKKSVLLATNLQESWQCDAPTFSSCWTTASYHQSCPHCYIWDLFQGLWPVSQWTMHSAGSSAWHHHYQVKSIAQLFKISSENNQGELLSMLLLLASKVTQIKCSRVCYIYVSPYRTGSTHRFISHSCIIVLLCIHFLVPAKLQFLEYYTAG